MTLLTHCHTIGGSDDVCTRLKGAIAFIFVWGCGQFLGPLSPVLLALAASKAPAWFTLVMIVAMGYAFVVPEESLYSPAWCRFVLSQAGWIKGGANLWATDDVLALNDRINESVMVCFHPHGLIPQGFVLNAAVRTRSQDPVNMPSWLQFDKTASGVQAPILFKIPILRHILLSFGCCVAATPARMHTLMASKTTFGIIPGGSEECAHHVTGEERIFLKTRAGFIKYALRYGYCVVIAFSFGEGDMYRSLSLMRPLNLWLVKRFGFVLPVFCGCALCPLLPRADVELHTVFGKAIQLPRIEDPTREDVEKHHMIYIAALRKLYDEHKEQFGYGERELQIV